jgi:hypothetical protein
MRTLKLAMVAMLVTIGGVASAQSSSTQHGTPPQYATPDDCPLGELGPLGTCE